MENEELEERMTPEEMQRYIDQAMREGKSYEDALKGLAWILGLHPAVDPRRDDGHGRAR